MNHSPDFAEWLGNPGTQAFAQGVRGDVERAMAVLMGVCALSSDPKVTSAWRYFDTMSRLHTTLTEKPREDDEAEQQDSLP